MAATPFELPHTERVYMGQRTADALAEEVSRLGARRVFMLTSSTLRHQTDEIAAVERALGDRLAAVHDGIPPHAPRTAVLAAAARARDVDADLVVAIGGGSVTDSGKIIPLALKYGMREHDDMEPYHFFVNEQGVTEYPALEAPDIRTICVPTTLSGGEFNALSGSTDEKIGHKQGYVHPKMAPVAVVLDPALTLHTPEWLWFSTGVRSVDHALEALGSLESNPYADGVAESALRLLINALPAVKRNWHDLEARLDCQVGVWQSMLPLMGGVQMGASHAIGHILGGTCDVPHGYCSCVMAPAVLKFNEPVNGHRQERIKRCFGVSDRSASALVDAFIRELGMPRSLEAVGIRPDQLDHIAEYTMLDFWARTNPRTIEKPADVREILDMAYSDH